MNETEKKYLEALHRDRSDSADTFEKPSNRAMWRSIVETYSDQAHFIYELIQNADDAGATSARFVLEQDRLIFAHNGKRHFSVSNPVTEDMDSTAGKIGDINAITGIAFSNKKTQENKIGKFGVGFKAVFQYTSTPHIYDPKFRFRIDRYIVPSILEDDFPGRRPEETLFVFPFDNKERNPSETYSDIEAKLKSLSYPVLFLSNLSVIKYEIGSLSGTYEKNIQRHYEFQRIVTERISLLKQIDEDEERKTLLLFTGNHDGLKYSIGYFLDEENQLIPVNEPAYCFFPTKENTGLKFLIHAPFLLTDSREGIRTGITHNNEMVNKIAELASDSFKLLIRLSEIEGNKYITDDILSIIPICETDFAQLDDTGRISFMPVYQKILEAFSTQEILPAREGYVTSKNAFMTSNLTISELFSDKQVSYICRNPYARLVFVSIGRDDISHSNRRLSDYLQKITNGVLNEDNILKNRHYFLRMVSNKNVHGIDATFIEKQETEWLHRFYQWIGETKKRTDSAKYSPIFLDQDSRAVAAYDSDNHHTIYLPSEGITGYRTIRDDLVSVPESYDFFVKSGITTPSLKDHVYDLIREYKSGKIMDNDEMFKVFFRFYLVIKFDEMREFISAVKNFKMFRCYHLSNPDDDILMQPTGVYFPSSELNEYFKHSSQASFLNVEYYNKLIDDENAEKLKDFFIRLGVRERVSLITVELSEESLKTRKDLPVPERSTKKVTYTETTIDGIEDIIYDINDDPEVSLVIWKTLINITLYNHGKPDTFFKGTCSYYYQRARTIEFVSSVTALLRETAWLFSKDKRLVSPSEIDYKMLSDIYDIESDQAQVIIEFLKFNSDNDNDDLLSEKQKSDIEIGRMCKKYGITKDDLLEIIKEKAKRNSKENITNLQENIVYTSDLKDKHGSAHSTDEHSENKPALTGTALDSKEHSKKISEPVMKVVTDILSHSEINTGAPENKKVIEDDDLYDEDEYTPKKVDYRRRVESEKEKASHVIEKIVQQEKLQAVDENTEKYSYLWFKTLLKMEGMVSGTSDNSGREVSISFAKAELEQGTKRTVVLKHPNKYIPQFLEDMSDFPVVFHMGNTTRKLIAEVANVKSYTLRVKLKADSDISSIDFAMVNEIHIEAQSPVFLLDALIREFDNLGYSDNYNMKKNLSNNIEFVFGPPGTGKTTYLASDVIIPLVKKKEQIKILVLTPTNKAADVLVRRVMSEMGTDYSYINWLLRFGGTSDEFIEQSGVYKERTYDINSVDRNVTVTTIARFPYDFFMPQGTRLNLRDINWDYIIIDEASMIPLANILYPLFKMNPLKFIIAGDPFQIEPITSVDLWKDQNIYKMVELDSFSNPVTVHHHKVVSLQTQYRSVPEIGNVFSRFAYDNILKHNRTSESRRPLNIENILHVEPLNIIKFPVSHYESIYKTKRLNNSSSYQIYSALFTYEFALYLSRKVSENNPGSVFRVGIIAPYRAQADLIEKLITAEKLPDNIEVQVGTIHGFQGDECDIIFVVFNPPPGISDRREMFLNKKTILNVSVSRARDYLFIVMPDDNTERIENLRQVNRIEKFIKNTESYTEYHSSMLEEQMFGSKSFLEDNSFTTGHQSVNVYGLPEMIYEIRTEDTAVDVQVHK